MKKCLNKIQKKKEKIKLLLTHSIHIFTCREKNNIQIN